MPSKLPQSVMNAEEYDFFEHLTLLASSNQPQSRNDMEAQQQIPTDVTQFNLESTGRESASTGMQRQAAVFAPWGPAAVANEPSLLLQHQSHFSQPMFNAFPVWQQSTTSAASTPLFVSPLLTPTFNATEEIGSTSVEQQLQLPWNFFDSLPPTTAPPQPPNYNYVPPATGFFRSRQNSLAESLPESPACSSSSASNDESSSGSSSQQKSKANACTHPGCNKAFPTGAALKSHILMHTGDRPFQCSVPNCGKAYTTNNRLNIHMRDHTNEKPYVCDYPGCSYAAKQKCGLTAHKRRHLDPEDKILFQLTSLRTVPCSYCNRVYKSASSRDQHSWREHGKGAVDA
ncbi:hypothetical protein BCR33DRAFT_714911 [Rhizoclosmatium globosum]|uniref:C2H2-type domain-containing protein n=1 Tax=Rhizoclosmatium globosum TaxID=329046 RepID=A0A1Y2CLF6_9FUNG|nr:hypothetical protein BCR33DRAFT_714911 [Rhizoclosmatium globosum]|eukprot:ORY47858.1 hypothetical protein BCR33DRAFT_714911 [Rhizoclosmatium globosum]